MPVRVVGERTVEILEDVSLELTVPVDALGSVREGQSLGLDGHCVLSSLADVLAGGTGVQGGLFVVVEIDVFYE
jgi:hypothetical protein